MLDQILGPLWIIDFSAIELNINIYVEGGSCADDTECSTSVLSERHISEWRTERATHYMDGV